jgi:hypothetical protein
VELWLVRDVPAWLVCLVLLLGLPLLMLGLDVVLHRKLPHRRLSRHNVVTGVIVSIVGVAYGVMIGLCVVSLWEGLDDAEQTTRNEAANLAALVPGSRVFDEGTQHSIADAVIRYDDDVAGAWQGRIRGRPSPAVTADLQTLAAIVGALKPTTAAQQSFVDDAVGRIARGQELRQICLFEVDDQQMSGVMWMGVLASTTAILGLCLFFGVEDDVVRRVLLIMATAVIATNLFLVVQMNYPYYGSFAVSPHNYLETVQALRPFSSAP